LAIDASLRPDNVDFPNGMRFSQRKILPKRELVVSVNMEEIGGLMLERLISTLDEVVSHVETASRTLESTIDAEAK
jgi:hypothetical protein